MINLSPLAEAGGRPKGINDEDHPDYLPCQSSMTWSLSGSLRGDTRTSVSSLSLFDARHVVYFHACCILNVQLVRDFVNDLTDHSFRSSSSLCPCPFRSASAVSDIMVPIGKLGPVARQGTWLSIGASRLPWPAHCCGTFIQ